MNGDRLAIGALLVAAALLFLLAMIQASQLERLEKRFQALEQSVKQNVKQSAKPQP